MGWSCAVAPAASSPPQCSLSSLMLGVLPGPLTSTSAAIHLHWRAPGGRDRLFLSRPCTGLAQRDVQLRDLVESPGLASAAGTTARKCSSGRPVLGAMCASTLQSQRPPGRQEGEQPSQVRAPAECLSGKQGPCPSA